jgi:very-short-patch-repair endonuclease
MVIAPNETITPILRGISAQCFNVAASRAQDRMYLVRSVELDALRETDELRRGLVSHFTHPFSQEEKQVDDLRELCESPFEREMYDELTGRGYRVKPQVKAGDFRIDMVVEGGNDTRLAVECDGDRYHGPKKWDEDMFQQRILERAGWRFWRCFASFFVMHREEVLQDLVQILTDHGVHPIGADRARRSVYIEYRTYSASKAKGKQQGFENEEIQAKANSPDTASVPIFETPIHKFQIIDEITPLPPLDEKEDETDSLNFINHDAVAPLPPLDEKEDETDSLKVQAGDFIDYIDLSIPNHRYHIWIALGQDDQNTSEINEAELIAQSMLKMKEGDIIEFNVPGRPPRRLKIIKISRPTDHPWR